MLRADQFISAAAADGPCVAIIGATSSMPAKFEQRTIAGSRMRTRGDIVNAFAEVWHFPAWFGRNMDAFDDFMRDLDNMIEVADGKPPAPGYFTHITDANVILDDEPDAFSWFAHCMPFYRAYYRDEATPSAVFGLFLSAPPDQLQTVGERWSRAGVPVAVIAE